MLLGMPRRAQCSRRPPAAAPLGRVAEQKIPASNPGVASANAYLKDHGDRMRSFLKALLQGIEPQKSHLPAVKNLDVPTLVGAAYLNTVK